MKRDNLFKKFKYSLYNAKKIAIYCKEGLGRAILYTLVLSVFLGLVQFIVQAVEINKVYNKIESALSDEKYSFNITNGVLDINTSPINEEESGFLLYVDDETTLDNIEKLESKIVNSDIYFLVLNDGFQIGSNDYRNSLVSFKYSDIGLDGFTNDDLKTSLVFSKVTFPILLVMQILSIFIYYLFDAIIISVFVTLSMFILRVKLRYSELISLILYTSTLPRVIVLIFSLIAPNVYFDTIGIIGTLLYTILILNEMKKNNIDKLV